MTLKLAGLLVVGLFGLTACTGSVPNSGPGAAGQTAAGNFQYNTPEFFSASIGTMVHFTVDQSTLTAEARSILDAQAKWLMDNPEFSPLIEGHADEQGTREYNLALGARRASSVKAYLVSQGVAADRLSTVTYGKERPLEICSSESCWSKNRRAVTVVRAANNS